MTVSAPLFQPNPAVRAPQPVDILQIDPAGFPDSGVFTEGAETLIEGFRALGYAADFHRNYFRPGVPVIVLAAHLIGQPDTLYFPSGAIIYNLEQILPDAWAANPGYLDLLRRHTVWDCSAESARTIFTMTGNQDVHHVPIGFVPSLNRIHPAPVQDIDLLFSGSITLRRATIEQLSMLLLNGSGDHPVTDILGGLYSRVSPGGYVVVADYGAVAACRQGVGEFCRVHSIFSPIQHIDGADIFWQVPRQNA